MEAGAATIAVVDLSRAKSKAELWSVRMAAAKSRQKEILLHSDERWMEWAKVRVESQKLLNLSAAQLAIGEEMKKLQNMYEDYSRKIKIQKSKSKRINLGEKATLKRIEKERVIVRETLKLMKDAVDCCGAAVTITGNILHHRIPFLKVEEVELIDIADLSILQRICASSCYKGLVLKFCVGKSVEKELMQLFGAAVSLLEEEEITMENDRLYQLSVDEKGVCHFEEDGSNKHMFWCQFKAMAEAEAMAIEFERAKRKEQFRAESMKNFAEKAENITLQQIERDSDDLKGSWSRIRADSQKLTILSTARSAIERELSRLETSYIIYSVKIHHLRENANANKLRLSTAEKNTAWVVKELKKRFKKEEKELKSTEKEINKEANRKPSGLVYHLLQWLNEKKVDAEDELRGLERRMADEEASLRVLRREVEENLGIIEAQSMIVKRNVATLEDTMKLRKDALGYCKSAIAMIEQVYLHRILMLKFDDAIASYVELVDITDVNIFQSICICARRSDGLRFCVVKDELLEIVAAIINKEEFVLKRDRVYELSVDEKGTHNVFELLIVEDFKRFYAAGTVNAFDPQTKKHTTILHDDKIEILNLREEKWNLFGDEQKEEADHSSSPFKEVMETTEKKTKRKQQQEQRVASSPKRSKGIATASTTTSKEEDRERIVN